MIRPERNTTTEAGLKTRLLDRRGLLNLIGYLTGVRDFQANVVDAGPGALRGYLANIPKVRVRGVEVDAAWALSPAVQAGNSGLIVGTPGEPRLIGLTLRGTW